VSLEDIINTSQRNHKPVKSNKAKKELEFPEELSLDTFVEDKAGKLNSHERRNDVPPLNVRKGQIDSRELPAKPRSVTPGKSKKDKKLVKRTKTPVTKKPRKS
jgi:hypothetical protein